MLLLLPVVCRSLLLLIPHHLHLPLLLLQMGLLHQSRLMLTFGAPAASAAPLPGPIEARRVRTGLIA